MTVTDQTYDRAAWLAWRKTGITATDSAAAVNLSPYASAYSVWCSKVGIGDDEIEVTDSMEFGTRAETLLSEWFADRENLYVVGQQEWCTHPTEPWMLATVDGAVVESPNSSPADALGGFEAKTTSDSVKAWDEQIPLHIVSQVQWQMGVTGHQRTWLATLHMAGRGVQFEVRLIERDDSDIAFLQAAARTLWFDHVVPGIAPPTDAHPATSKAMGYWDAAAAKTLEADDEATRLAAEIRELKAAVKDMETSIDTRCNRLKDLMRDAEVLTHGFDDKGRPRVVATWKASTRKQFVKDFALTDFPELAEPPYTIETPTRTFLAK